MPASDRQDSVPKTKSASDPDPDLQFANWIMPPLKHAWYLTGPTASGKTPLAVALAQRLDAEIISMDSMAIYRGMNIGTAKPSLEQRADIPHHQLDIVDPSEVYSVSRFVSETHEIAAQIRQRGKHVLICGGTPLYLKALIRGLFQGPEADWEFRTTVEADIERFGADALRKRLAQVDPLSAHKLHPNDHRRMIRALEVAKLTGQPLSHWQQQFELPASREDCPIAVLQLDRGWLHTRINQRVAQMLDAGLEAEVRGLSAKYEALGQTARQAVGYREMLDFIQSNASADSDGWHASAATGEPAQPAKSSQPGDSHRSLKAITIEATAELIRAHTRQFARRQEVWFRGLQELQGVVVTSQSSLPELVDQVATIFLNADH